MFNANNKLDIFERFLIDMGLPKHSRSDDWEEEGSEDSGIAPGLAHMKRTRRRFRMTSGEVWGEDVGAYRPWHVRLVAWFRELIKPSPPKPSITIQAFFKAVKLEASNLELVAERAAGYELALIRARATGQTALLERLQEGIEAVRAETRLMDLGLTRVLPEATLVEFVKKSPKGLRLDWVQNFTRHIPDDVLERKKQCDAERVFDNYVVLHYDPDAKSYAETRKEAAARKDPILFGVLAGRRQLYFVGEWVDEYCDLSLDQIADVLGRRGERVLDPSSFD